MHRNYNPSQIAPPFSRYSHAVEASSAERWLHISGQVGVTPEGAMREGAAAQIRQALENLLAVLAAARMSVDDLVKITAILARHEDVGTYREIREEVFGRAAPASTLIVAGLANPEWLFEVEAVAARPDSRI